MSASAVSHAEGPVADLLGALHQACDRQRQRLLVAVIGPTHWSQRCVERFHGAHPDYHTLTPAEHRPGAVIGQDLRGAILDLRQQMAPDLLGATAGAVVAGHLCVLLLPSATDLGASAFGQRLLQRLRSDEQALVIEDTQPLPGRPQLPSGIFSDATPPCRTRDQAAAVQACERLISGRARRPLVLTADRGRGKSSALGLAAASALQAGHGPLLVTAPAPSQVAGLFRHAADVLGETLQGRWTLASGRLRFVAPDTLLHNRPEARAVLVDEAAALPVPVLSQLLEHYGRIAFATTTHGYEGMGRGFDLRFRRVLEQRTPDWRQLTLNAPIRYAANDWLEPVIFGLLCLNAAPAQLPASRTTAPITQWYTGVQLAQDERLLRELFGLLVLAHYRTRPADLAHLLDSPALQMGVQATANGTVIGCVLMQCEGGLDTAMAEAVKAGQRRPAGEHGSGILAAQIGLADGARLQSGRIMRIAVHPQRQRQGLGQSLLLAAQQRAQELGLELLTSSFGAHPGLLDFWSRAGYVLLRLGLRREARSGEHAALVARPLGPQARDLIARATTLLRCETLTQLATSLQDLEPGVTTRLLQAAPPEPHSTLHYQQCRRWLAGEVPFEAVPGSLQQVLAALLARSTANSCDAETESAALIDKVLHLKPWPVVVQLLQARGRTDAEARLRRTFRDLIGKDDDPGTGYAPPMNSLRQPQ